MDRVLLDDTAGGEDLEGRDWFLGLSGRPGGLIGYVVGFERPGGGPLVPVEVISTAITTVRETVVRHTR